MPPLSSGRQGTDSFVSGFVKPQFGQMGSYVSGHDFKSPRAPFSFEERQVQSLPEFAGAKPKRIMEVAFLMKKPVSTGSGAWSDKVDRKILMEALQQRVEALPEFQDAGSERIYQVAAKFAALNMWKGTP